MTTGDYICSKCGMYSLLCSCYDPPLTWVSNSESRLTELEGRIKALEVEIVELKRQVKLEEETDE